MKAVVAIAFVFAAVVGCVSAVPVGLRRQQKPLAPPTAPGSATPIKPLEMQRNGKWAVDFVRDFDKTLNLPADRMKAREALLASDPFLFFRATPGLFHADLATHAGHKARSVLNPSKTSPKLTIGGDIHAANFGTFRAPNEKEAVWGVNDYDQTGSGTADQDLTRLATSIILAARNNKLVAGDQTRLVELLGSKYFDEIYELVSKGGRDPYFTGEKASGKVKELIVKATEKKRGKFLDKYTKETPGTNAPRKFLVGSDPELLALTDASISSSIIKLLTAKGYKVIEVIEKIGSGGSSNGLPRYWALIENPKKTDKNPYILEIKCLLPPGLEYGKKPADAKGLLTRQKLVGGLANPLSDSVAGGVHPGDKRDYIIREIEPEKDSLKLETLTSADLTDLVTLGAKVLARLHTQSGSKTLAAAISKWVTVGDLKSAVQRLKEFAFAYADQVAIDHKAYKAAVGK